MSKVNTYQIAAVDRYANALFQLAKEAKVLDSVSNELTRIKEILQVCLLYTSDAADE